MVAAMDATTVGSNIIAVTPVGRILSVVLAAIGMMMFPIFTVYITNILTRHHQEGTSLSSQNFITPYSDPDKNDNLGRGILQLKTTK